MILMNILSSWHSVKAFVKNMVYITFDEIEKVTLTIVNLGYITNYKV